MLSSPTTGGRLPWPLSTWYKKLHSHALHSAYVTALPLGMGYVELVLDCLRREGLCDTDASMFSIGPGTARVELAWLARGTGELGYVERYRPYHQGLVKQARDLGLHHRICAAHLGDFRELESSRRYDCVLSVQSWFSLWQDRKALDRALALCNATGKLIIVLRAEKDDLHPFVRTGSGERTAEKLSDWAAELGYQHRRVVIDHEIAADRFREGRQLAHQARALFGFLNYKPWPRLPEELRRAIEVEFIGRSQPVRRQKLALIFEAKGHGHT